MIIVVTGIFTIVTITIITNMLTLSSLATLQVRAE
jgi:hypothetical protein